MAQRCSASSPPSSPVRGAPPATCATARSARPLLALAFLAAVVTTHAGAMYVPAAPVTASAANAKPPGGEATGKCADGLAVSLTPEAQAMTAVPSPSLSSTAAPVPVETTEAPSLASTTLEPLDAPTTVWPEVAATSSPAPSAPALSLTAAAETVREEERSLAQQRREVEESLTELFTRASSRMGRYAAGFPQVHARSLFSRRMSLVPPPPPRPYEAPPEVSKDVYIHLAADESAPTTPAPPALPRRKHYKIIVIKPPTPAPPVETTTRRVDVETLIYVLVPKGEAPSPAPTTPHAPSKHEVFFIRYKAPVENKTAPVGGAEGELAFSQTPGTTTTTTRPPTPDYANLVDLRSSSSEIMARTASDEDEDEDENELDGTVRDSDAINDLLSVSTDDIVRSWRRADGDIHFDTDLKRIARSHSSQSEASAEKGDKSGVVSDAKDAVKDTALPPARCRQYATAEDLNAALDVGDEEEGKRVEGAPDFDAVLQGKAHYGRSAEVAEICAEKSDSEPFAIRDVPAPSVDLEQPENENDSVDARNKADVVRKAKFSARYASSLIY